MSILFIIAYFTDSMLESNVLSYNTNCIQFVSRKRHLSLMEGWYILSWDISYMSVHNVKINLQLGDKSPLGRFHGLKVEILLFTKMENSHRLIL